MAIAPVAPGPAATTSIPMTQPPAPTATRIESPRPGWQMSDGSVVYDDGEKVVPTSGKSDAQKREEALRAALGDLPGPQVPGADGETINRVRSEAARLEAAVEVDAARLQRVKEIAALQPAASEEVARKRVKSVPPSAAEQAATLRAEVRRLVDAEAARVEELKELALRGGIVLARDGLPVAGNGAQQVHERLIEAITAAERGDVTKATAALAELRRWSLTGEIAP